MTLEVNMELGQTIRCIRYGRGMTQKELADAAYIKPATLSAMETGRNGVSQDRLIAIARALNMPVWHIQKLAAEDYFKVESAHSSVS